MYIGWVAADFEDMNELLGLGIMVGNYNKEEMEFQNCRCTEVALKKLDPYWGKYVWGFREVEKNGDIELGSKIIEINSGNKLTVKIVFEPGTSEFSDFKASYGLPTGIDRFGNIINPTRSFSFKDEGIVWKRAE